MRFGFTLAPILFMTITMPDLPEVTNVDIREGVNEAILYDGSGEHHKCP